jgi:hypothetical protein
MTIDARLVKSSARPKSNEKIKVEKQKRETAEGNLDRTGKPLKMVYLLPETIRSGPDDDPLFLDS